MTWIKRLIFCLFVFLGLYLFGDFRINEVNVRDKLRTMVPPETVIYWKDKTIDAFANAFKAIQTTLADDSLNSKKKTQQDKAPQEEFSTEETEKLKELMDQLLSVPELPTKK